MEIDHLVVMFARRGFRRNLIWTLTKEFTLAINHLDVKFVINGLQIDQIGINIYVVTKIDLVLVTYEKKTLFSYQNEIPSYHDTEKVPKLFVL